MIDHCERAIRALGIAVTITVGEVRRIGYGVILPVRNSMKSSGGVSFGNAGITEPQRFRLIATKACAAGMRCGDRVNDGDNEYYVLWADCFEGKYGSYIKAEIQLVREGRINEQLADDERSTDTVRGT